jgi:hypothetical protein
MHYALRRSLLTTLALTSIASSSCGGSAPRTETPAITTRPRLVVLVVYDQLASWVLELHEDSLSPEGAVRWISDRGLHVERAHYAYAGTFTAPGHAAIVSGASPSESGVPSNRVWDLARQARVSSFDDGVHALVNRPDAFGSPDAMRAEGVADILYRTHPEARIVALGMKDRSTLPPGGHHPTLTLWFDALAGGFTTSTQFRTELPAWVQAFALAHPWESYRRVWEPLRAYDELGPDDAPGEGSYGFASIFPHDANGLTEIDAFLSLPYSTELLVELAREAVVQEHLGEDEVTDFLSLSIASTDYVGHGFGPESWEARDNLIRSDREVGRFLAALSERMEIAVVLTSDHGVAPLPERAAQHGLPTHVRWSSAEELPLLRAHLDASLGAREGGWVDAWVVPYITFSDSVRMDPALRARAMEATLAYVSARPGMGIVVDAHRAAELRASEDEAMHAVGLSITSDPPGDVYVMPSSGSVCDDSPGTTGTAHGSPFDYDREVPVLVAGPGVAHARVETRVEQARVSSTLAHLLGIEAPTSARPLTQAE